MPLSATRSSPSATASRTSVTVIKKRVTGTVASAPEEDSLAIEDPIEIVLHYDDAQAGRTSKALTLTMRTPGHDAEMITGFNVSLIGFVRNGSYNIYSCPERIRTPKSPRS